MLSRPARRVALLCVLFLTALPSAAWAAGVRTGERVEVAGPTDDDVYAVGAQIRIPGAVVGDVFALGSRVAFSGSTAGSLNVAARVIEAGGQVGGSARLAGQDVAVSGNVAGDLLAAGQTVAVGPRGVVGRDLVLAARTVRMEGRVNGRITGRAETLTISGIVSGVEVSAGRVVLEEGARVDGDLVYTSATRAQVAEGAVVTGRLVQRRPPESSGGSPALGALTSVVGALVLGLAVLWLLPPLLPAAAQALRQSPGAVAGGAVAGLVLIPFAVVGLLAGALFTGVGLWLAALVAAGYGMLLILAKVIAGFALGTAVLRRADVDPRTDFPVALLCLVVGVVIIGMLSVVPYLGAVILGLTAFAGFGAGLVAFLSWRRRARSVSITGSSISY